MKVLREGRRPIVLCGVAGLALIAGLWLALLNRHLDPETIVPSPASAFWWSQALATLTFLVVALVLVRRPEIGWSVWCAAAALGHAVGLAAQGWALQIFVAGRDLPFGNIAVWLLLWVIPIEVPAGNWMLMTAPDGSLPRRGWRWALAWLTMAVSGAGVLAGEQGPARREVGGKQGNRPDFRRNGIQPVPGRPTWPVSNARLASPSAPLTPRSCCVVRVAVVRPPRTITPM